MISNLGILLDGSELRLILTFCSAPLPKLMRDVKDPRGLLCFPWSLGPLPMQPRTVNKNGKKWVVSCSFCIALLRSQMQGLNLAPQTTCHESLSIIVP